MENRNSSFQAFLSRRDLLAKCGLAGGGLLLAGAARSVAAESTPPAPRFQINLGDFAKGDGSDETDAIQAAINSIPSSNAEHFGAELIIPRPPKFYGISKTILIEEKWNCSIRCATPAIIERVVDIGHDHYFQWLGGDHAMMFRVNACKGLRLINLSMNGRDKSFSRKEYTGTTQGVIGVSFGPATAQAGFDTDIVVDSLSIVNVHDGVLLGEFPNNGPDVRTVLFNHLVVTDFANRGLVMQSGNLATITLINPSLYSFRADGKYAKACIEGSGGELLSINHNSAGLVETDILIHAGGIQIVKAWSEIFGSFLKTDSIHVNLAPDAPYYGTISYPMILEGCRHFSGAPGFLKDETRSVVYDLPVPLNMIGCTFYGDIELGEASGGCILDQGTLFINPASKFIGPGVTRHHRVVHLGSTDPKNGRLLQPYFVDRRNVPGTQPPSTGVWQRGDGIVNIEPDPNVPAKACRGWLCVEAGEPGKWFPYGGIVSAAKG